MSNDNAQRQKLRLSLNAARSQIRGYTGLYSDENLVQDVLRICDGLIVTIEPNHRIQEARVLVDERCRRLAHAADRFSGRDPVVIAASRMQAIAAVDMFQDAVLDYYKAIARNPGLGLLLRGKSL